jgi:hypothetical protein
MLRQVFAVSREWLFVNPWDMTRRTEGFDDSILLGEFWTKVVNGFYAVMGIGNSG